MLEEKIEITYKDKFYVTRICDVCGKKDLVQASAYAHCRLYRGLDKDLCRSCSNTHRRKPLPINAEHGRWKGGIGLGYKLITVRDPITGKCQHLREHRIIYEQFLGRKLLKSEEVHHIDLNRINNKIENLFLCSSKSLHSLVHHSMEVVGFLLLDKKVWYDKHEKTYILNRCDEMRIEPVTGQWHTITKRNKLGHSYLFVQDAAAKKQMAVHTLVMEMFLGRKLFRNECVHHIDGNTLNNDINNLVLLTISEHFKAHKSLQTCVSELYKTGEVIFDKILGRYEAKKETDSNSDE